MKLRYKTRPDDEFSANTFNMSALSEVLTGDDSAFVRDLDCLIEHSFTGLCPTCGHFWMDHMDPVLLKFGKIDDAKKHWWCRHDQEDCKCLCDEKYEPQWKDLGRAMTDRDVINDNNNRYFFEPRTAEDRIRGYTL